MSERSRLSRSPAASKVMMIKVMSIKSSSSPPVSFTSSNQSPTSKAVARATIHRGCQGQAHAQRCTRGSEVDRCFTCSNDGAWLRVRLPLMLPVFKSSATEPKASEKTCVVSCGVWGGVWCGVSSGLSRRLLPACPDASSRPPHLSTGVDSEKRCGTRLPAGGGTEYPTPGAVG